LEAVSDGISRNGVPVVFSAHAETASTDGHRITLPTPPFEITKSEWRQLNGYIDHECGHVLWTAMDRHRKWMENMEGQGKGDKARAIHTLFNVTEDARINRRAIKEWPGTKENLGATYAVTLGDHIDDPEKFIAEGTMGIVNGLHARLEGYDLPGHFTPEVKAVVDKAYAIAYPVVIKSIDLSKEDAYVTMQTMVKDLYALLKGSQQDQQGEDKSEQGEGESGEQPQGEGEGEGGQGEGSGSGDLGDLDDSQEGEGQGKGERGEGEDSSIGSDGQGEGDGDDATDGTSGTGQGESHESGANGGSGGGVSHSPSKDIDRELAKIGDEIDKAMKDSVPQTDNTSQYKNGIMFPNQRDGARYEHQCAEEAKTAKHLPPGVGARWAGAKDLHNPTGFAPKLRRVLQADAMSRRRGGLEDGIDLDLDRLPAFVAGAPIVDVFERKHRGRAPTIAVNLALDGSSSMKGGARREIQDSLAIALGHAFRRNGIKFRISVMSTDGRCGVQTYGPIIVKEFEEPWNMKTSPGALHMGAAPLGGTPILTNLFDGIMALRKRKESRRILFIITDGQIGYDNTFVTKWHDRMLLLGQELVFCNIGPPPDMGPDIARIDFPPGFIRNHHWNAGPMVDHIAEQIPGLIIQGERALRRRRGGR